MTLDETLAALEREWDCDGFLDHVRRGVFERHEGEEFLALIKAINIDDEALVPKRMLSLVWYLPSFMEWQRERVQEVCGRKAEYDRFLTEVQNAMEDVFGVP